MRTSRRRRFVPSMDHLGARIVLSDVTGGIDPDPIVTPPPPTETPPIGDGVIVGDVPVLPPDTPIVT